MATIKLHEIRRGNIVQLPSGYVVKALSDAMQTDSGWSFDIEDRVPCDNFAGPGDFELPMFDALPTAARSMVSTVEIVRQAYQ